MIEYDRIIADNCTIGFHWFPLLEQIPRGSTTNWQDSPAQRQRTICAEPFGLKKGAGTEATEAHWSLFLSILSILCLSILGFRILFLFFLLFFFLCNFLLSLFLEWSQHLGPIWPTGTSTRPKTWSGFIFQKSTTKTPMTYRILSFSYILHWPNTSLNDIKNDEKNPLPIRSFSALSTMACKVPSWLHSCATNLRAQAQAPPGAPWRASLKISGAQ